MTYFKFFSGDVSLSVTGIEYNANDGIIENWDKATIFHKDKVLGYLDEISEEIWNEMHAHFGAEAI